MKIKELIQGVKILSSRYDAEKDIQKMSFDSRNVDENTVFFAIKGFTNDGHQFIPQVLEKGCNFVVIEDGVENIPAGIDFIQVSDTSIALGKIASNFYDNPSKQLRLIGITGTNGKTTTATLSFELFRALGYNVGLLSTVVNKINDREIPSTHTTPDPIELNKLLAEMVEEGCDFCFMEVSSHAIAQNRIAGLRFEVAGFTNITHDHLDYHKTFENYVNAKLNVTRTQNSNDYFIAN